MIRRLPIRIESPCREDWSAMPRAFDREGGDGRRCAQCTTTVVDLSAVTRSRAEAMLRERGGTMCARVRSDDRGEAIFAAEPTRAGLLPVALAGLLAACSTATPEVERVSRQPIAQADARGFDAPTRASFGGSLATGVMMPVAAISPSVVAALEPTFVPGLDVAPTREQRELTRRKEQARYLRTHPPIPQHTMGVMVLGIDGID